MSRGQYDIHATLAVIINTSPKSGDLYIRARNGYMKITISMNFHAMIWKILSLGVLIEKGPNTGGYRTALPRYRFIAVTAVWRNYDQLITYSQTKRFI